MSNFTVTLKQLRESGACFDGYNKLVASISGEPLVKAKRYATYDQDEPIEIIQILDSNGLDDALWSLRCVSGEDKAIRLFAVWCARQVQHLMKDKRSVAALDVAENFANGLASSEELMAARDEAWDAAWDAARDEAWAAARDAALAAARDAAGDAAWDAAWDAAGAAAWDAARDAALAAARDAAGDAAWDAAGAAALAAVWDAAWDAEQTRQTEQFRKMLNGELA